TPEADHLAHCQSTARKRTADDFTDGEIPELGWPGLGKRASNPRRRLELGPELLYLPFPDREGVRPIFVVDDGKRRSRYQWIDPAVLPLHECKRQPKGRIFQWPFPV